MTPAEKRAETKRKKEEEKHIEYVLDLISHSVWEEGSYQDSGHFVRILDIEKLAKVLAPLLTKK